MEQDNNTPETGPEIKQSKFTDVTPLSKYLAMILFITLPFIGGWIGYQYAPEKVVEVESIVEVEKKVEAEAESSKSKYTDEIRVGDVVAGMEVASIKPFRSEVCVDESCVEKKSYPLSIFGNSVLIFKGTKTLKGKIVWGEGVPVSAPYFQLNNPQELPYGPRIAQSVRISQEAYEYYGEGSHEVIISEYIVNSYPSEVENYIEIVLPN